MYIIFKHIEIIERIDRLIRTQSTGSPNNLALRLGISKNKLYRIIEIMKKLDAPIEYSAIKESYMYTEIVTFSFGFCNKDGIKKS